MKCIAMIPARYAASRFPAKLMQDLGGKPVIVRTYEATVATQLFEDGSIKFLTWNDDEGKSTFWHQRKRKTSKSLKKH